MAIAKNPKIIMDEKQFVNRLVQLRSRKTFYKNKYPYNLCYINKDGRTSADCVNLVKAVLNGYNVYNNSIGYYQKDLSNTGDCTEAELLAQCADVSSDFTILGKHPEILYMKGHIGVYIGMEVDGMYNVIECTTAYGGGIVYSWIDADGTRRNQKGGYKSKKWTHHGRPSRWVSECTESSDSGENDVADENTKQKIYFVKKGDTLSQIAYSFNMTLARLLSYNPQIKNPNVINVGDKIYLTSQTVEAYYSVKPGDTLSAIAKKHNMSLQKLLGLNPDIKNPNIINIGQKIRIK